jgi:hypothetical protein
MSRRQPRSTVSGNPHYTSFVKLIREAARRHDTYTIFRDFCEMAALALSRADFAQAEAREAEYLKLAEKHKENIGLFPQMMAELTMAHEVERGDHLGSAFQELELNNKDMGQFFTPYHVSSMMATMTVDQSMKDKIAEHGFIRASDPASGAGGMMVALCYAMGDAGINFQQDLHVVAQDLDIRAVHMSYVQLSLIGCPAVVIHGNSLTFEQRSHWYTPLHVIGLWSHKLRRRSEEDARNAPPRPEPVPEPVVEPVLLPALLFDADPQAARMPPPKSRKAAPPPKSAPGQFTLF